MIFPTPLLASLATPHDIGFGEPSIIHKHKVLDFVDKIQSQPQIMKNQYIWHIITDSQFNDKACKIM
jgi:hypothetical protein